MSRIRDIKRQARRDLHEEARIPALYIVGSSDPVDVNVRIHKTFAKVGDVPGSEAYVERRDIAPKIIFDRDDVALPKRGAIVSVETGEAYRIGDAEVADDEFITAHVAQLTAAEATGLPVPAAS